MNRQVVVLILGTKEEFESNLVRNCVYTYLEVSQIKRRLRAKNTLGKRPNACFQHKLRYYGPSENGAILTEDLSQLLVFIVKRESSSKVQGLIKLFDIKEINKVCLRLE